MTTINTQPTYTTVWQDINKTGISQYRIWRNDGTYVRVKFGRNRIGNGTNDTDRVAIYSALQQMYYTKEWFKKQCEEVNVVIFVRNGFHISPGESVEHITFAFQSDRGAGASKHYHAYFHSAHRREYQKIIGISECVSVLGRWCFRWV